MGGQQRIRGIEARRGRARAKVHMRRLGNSCTGVTRRVEALEEGLHSGIHVQRRVAR